MVYGSSYYEGKDEQETRFENKRAQKAKVFNEYVQSRVQAGLSVDPLELDNLRLSLSAGDPFAASLIPAGEALKQLAERTNDESRMRKLQISNGLLDQKNTERQFIQKIIDDNWDKSEAEMADVFSAAFGDQDGTRLYGQYKPELSGLLAQATGKKYADLSANPASKMVNTEEDLYRYFPAEMRNPKTATLLKGMVADNQRKRRQEDFSTIGSIVDKTPDFVINGDAETQQWWKDFAAQGAGYANAASMPDGGMSVNIPVQGQVSQVTSENMGKLVTMASKDPLFMAANQSGDEESIFNATVSLMAQAGLRTPSSPFDPAYIEAKKRLDLVGRTHAISSYQKREADLRSVVTTQTDAIVKNSKNRLEAMATAAMPIAQYSGTKQKDAKKLDPQIQAALDLVTTNPNFFPSDNNLRSLVDFVKSSYDKGKQDFSPEAVAGQFLAEAEVEHRAEFEEGLVTQKLESEYGIKPGTNFQTWSQERVTALQSAIGSTLDEMAKPMGTQAEYENALQSKAVIVQALRQELETYRTAVNTLNNDPAKRASISNYDYNRATQSLRLLENYVRSVELFNPEPPVSNEVDWDSMPKAPIDTGYQVPAGPAPSQPDPYGQPRPIGDFPPPSGYTPINFAPDQHQRSRMDSYLDDIAMAESSGNPFARASTSSAAGLFQFTSGTWNSMVQRYGEREGITRDDIYNPAAQRTMAAYLTMENAGQLIRNTGRMPTEKDLYLAHFLGPSAASVVINNQGSNLLAANLFPDAARANKSIFYEDGMPVTIDRLYQKLGRKVTNRDRNNLSTVDREA